MRGTLFLDEIGSLGPALQAKLLRFLETRSFKRVGGLKDVEVDIRVVAATNQDLERLVREEKFRKDLYYRLNVCPIEPAAPGGAAATTSCRWSGTSSTTTTGSSASPSGGWNPRPKRSAPALRLARQRPRAQERRRKGHDLRGRSLITAGDLAIGPEPRPTGEIAGSEAKTQSLPEAEREMIVRTLQSTNGNVSRAAQVLGISRDTLRYKLKKIKREEAS